MSDFKFQILPLFRPKFQFLPFYAFAVTIYFMNSATDEMFYRWLIESVGGLILIGFGLSLFGQAVIYKATGAPLKKWFWWGTLSLVVINAGICVFGDAVKQRMIYESRSVVQEKSGS
jgi:hypothetical protein